MTSVGPDALQKAVLIHPGTVVRFLVEPLVRSRTLLTGLKPPASNGQLSPSKVAGTISPTLQGQS